MSYDSKPDTEAHIDRVGDYIQRFIEELDYRASVHDVSKLLPPEKELFDIYSPLLKTLVFNSPEYKESLAKLKPALDHHYAVNDHHPEHYPDGVNGMNIFALTEMIADWKAASERQATSVLNLTACFERFKIEPQLQSIIRNTAEYMNWDVI